MTPPFSPRKIFGEIFCRGPREAARLLGVVVGVLEKPQGFLGWSPTRRRCPFGSVYSSKKEKVQILKPVICSRVFAIQPLTRCVLYDRMLIEESFLPHTKEIFSKKYHKIFRGFAFKVN